jgi:DHA1 family multidrug resistance protein-like MFS transporter
MSDLIREAAIGQIIRYVTAKRFFKYPEEEPDFIVPEAYAHPDSILKTKTQREELAIESIGRIPTDNDRQESENNMDLEKAVTQYESVHPGPVGSHGYPNTLGMLRTKSREETVPFSPERLQVERIMTIERATSAPIVPAVTNDGDILVDWYTVEDDSNPQNWSVSKKNFATIIIW